MASPVGLFGSTSVYSLSLSREEAVSLVRKAIKDKASADVIRGLFATSLQVIDLKDITDLAHEAHRAKTPEIQAILNDFPIELFTRAPHEDQTTYISELIFFRAPWDRIKQLVEIVIPPDSPEMSSLFIQAVHCHRPEIVASMAGDDRMITHVEGLTLSQELIMILSGYIHELAASSRLSDTDDARITERSLTLFSTSEERSPKAFVAGYLAALIFAKFHKLSILRVQIPEWNFSNPTEMGAHPGFLIYLEHGLVREVFNFRFLSEGGIHTPTALTPRVNLMVRDHLFYDSEDETAELSADGRSARAEAVTTKIVSLAEPAFKFYIFAGAAELAWRRRRYAVAS